MSVSAETRPSFNPLFGVFILVLAAVLAISVTLMGNLAVFGLLAAFLFILFVGYPVLGLYATTALLLLSGSAGVIGFVSEGSTLAVTLAKLCGLAALSAWAINVLTRKIHVELSAPVVLLGAFCVWALTGSVLSVDVRQTWPEWIRLITLFGYFLLAVNTLNSRRNIHIFVILLLLCGLAMSFVAVAQYCLPQYHFAGAEAWRGLGAVEGAYIDQESLQGEAAIRVSGRAGHSNWLAMIVLLILPLNFYWYSLAKTKKLKALIIFTIGIELVTLVLTYTRTGLMIGLVLGFLLLLKKFVRVSALRVFAFLFAVVIAWSLLPGAYKERVLSPKQYTGSKSVQSRIELQKAAGRYFLENPVVGLGMGGFGLEFIHERNDTAQMMKFMVNKQGWLPVFIGTHNMPLQLGCDTGAIGLVLFSAFFVLMMRRLFLMEKQYRAAGDVQGAALASALFVSLIGFMFCTVFLHALLQKIWWMIAALAVVLPLYAVNFKEGLASVAPRTDEAGPE